MQKKELMELINSYHQTKGWGRRLFATTSCIMKQLSQFADQLNEGEITGAQLNSLYDLSLSSLKPSKQSCKLSVSLLLTVYLRIIGPYLRQRVQEIKEKSGAIIPHPTNQNLSVTSQSIFKTTFPIHTNAQYVVRNNLYLK